MKALRELSAQEAKRLEGVVFDLDGTVLDEGRLGLGAYQALHSLAEAGLRLVACTGRPAGWGEVVARQWPIDMAISENGAIAFYREGARLRCADALDAEARSARQHQLEAVVATLKMEFDDIPMADDNQVRISDRTFDVGEYVRVPPERRQALHRRAAELGARTFESSIHLHVTLDMDDKASGSVRFMHERFGCDVSRALSRYAFIGDSGNDEACFSAFRNTFGVSNIRPYLSRLSIGPRFICRSEAGEGFAEFAKLVLVRRQE